MDINGDSIPDIIDLREKSSEDSKIYFGKYAPYVDRVHKVKSINTETALSYINPRIQSSSNKAPFPVQVLESMTHSDGIGNTTETTYKYKGADYYYGNPHDKKFAGFAEVTETKANGSKVLTKYHQANGQTGNEKPDNYFTLGKIYETSIYDEDDNLYTRERINYAQNPNGTGSRFVQTSSVLKQIFDGNSNSVDTAESYSYDDYGNLTKHIQHGKVNGSANGDFSDTGADKKTIDKTYLNDDSNYYIGYPTSELLKNNTGDLVAQTNYLYDASANFIKESKFSTSSDASDTHYEYNSSGQVIKTIDPLGNATIIEHDDYHMYPKKVINALGQIEQMTYDTVFGNLLLKTDANANTVKNDYDAVGRLLRTFETFADGGLELVKSYEYDDFNSPAVIAERTHNQGTDDLLSVRFIDGLGRTIQTKTGHDNNIRVIDSVYNDKGELEKSSLPYSANQYSFDGFNAQNDLYTEFEYDALGRVIKTENVKGETLTEYNGFQTQITDALGNKKDLITDAFSNLVQVNEYNDGAVYQTRYEYNPQNLLTKIIDAEDNERNIEYDMLGRRTKLEDLHHASDSNFGTWNYAYNDRDLISETSPNGDITSYSYDALGRTLAEDNNSSSGIEKSFVYDSCAFGIGKLCSVTTNDITKNLSYYKDGNLKSESKTIDSQNFDFNYSYDNQGRLSQKTFPNGNTISYEYTPFGEQASINYAGQTLAQAEYGVHGKVTNMSYQNGSQTSYDFDEHNLYELTKKVSESNGNEIQNISYHYDPVGNITKIERVAENDTKHTQVYTYDDLYRLIETRMYDHAGDDNSYTRMYQYSPIGNIMNMSDGVSLNNQYTYAHLSLNANPHAVASINGTPYNYDNNGNLLSDSTWNHSWNYDNTLNSSINGSSTSSYSYDESKQRIKRVENGTITLIPSSEYEVENGQVKVSLNLGDHFVATDDNVTLSYIYTDHLGGTEIITDTSGNPNKSFVYYPFGSTHTETGNNDESKQYTGYTKDDSTGLHYAGARYYENEIGRFISQDPVALSIGDWNTIKEKTNGDIKTYLSNPQTHNSYSYAFNNPLKYDDNNGEFGILTQLASVAAYKSSTEYAGEKLHQNGYGAAAVQLSNQSRVWDAAISNPEVAGAATGVVGGAASYGGVALINAVKGNLLLSSDASGKLITQTGVRSLQTRDTLLKGTTNPKLQRIIGKLFQRTDKFPGGTAGAVQRELSKGISTGGRLHSQKALDAINGLGKVIRNPQSSKIDVSRAGQVIKTLKKALKTVKKQ